MKITNTAFRFLALFLPGLVLASLFLAASGTQAQAQATSAAQETTPPASSALTTTVAATPNTAATTPAVTPKLTTPSSGKTADNCQSFPQTGFSACGLFLQYWKANGGLAQQGYPISAVFYERNSAPPAGDGQIHLVQYFQRARFEYHPENPPPYNVLLGLLATEQYSAKYEQVPLPDDTYYNGRTDCQTFSETGFQVCGQFLQYWKANGGLTQQGYPISPVFQEENAPPPAGDGKIHLVQYFQRARFEQHDENIQPYDVLLGLLGAEQYKTKYGVTPPEFLGNEVPLPTPDPGKVIIPANGCLPAKDPGNSGAQIIQACVPDGAPLKNSVLPIYGRLIINGQPVVGARFDATWHFSAKLNLACGGFTSIEGVASCSIDLAGNAVAGTPVKVDVVMSNNGGQTSKVTLTFTPR